MAYETVLLERRADVGVLTLNRPDQMNAIDDAMARELGEAVAELNDDPEVSAIVMTGAGRAFCAGADVRRFERAATAEANDSRKGPSWAPADDASAWTQAAEWISTVRGGKPVVGAVNGHCIGSGLTRILPCDVRIASSEARFSMKFVMFGLIPEIGSTQILAQVVGLQPAADLILSGRTISAEEALEIGLVLEVVAPGELLDRAMELASDYGRNGPTALREAKRLLYTNHVEADVDLVTKREVEVMHALAGGAENQEAVTAFREKRPPRFREVGQQGR